MQKGRTTIFGCTHGGTALPDGGYQVELKSYAPLKALIEMPVLDLLDIRIGTIKTVAEVPGSDKLLELRVNFGDHKRSILAGMKGERGFT